MRRADKAEDSEKGVVTESDDWWDTLQLGGVPTSAQVLVEWPRDGNPVRAWARISDLVVAK